MRYQPLKLTLFRVEKDPLVKMGAKHTKVHKAFLDLSRPFSPTKVYEAMCKLVGLSEDATERGIGKLFREGKLKTEERAKVRRPKRSARGGAPDNF